MQETIVFLDGLVCNNKHWTYQIDYFLSKGFDILLHNYRFHFGSTSKEEINKCTFSEMATDLEHLLEELNIKKTVLIGHSMGVNVAIEHVLKFNHRSAKIVAIGGNPIRPQDTMFGTNLSNFTIPLVQKLSNLKPNWFEFLWKNAHKNYLLRKIVLHGGFHPENVEDEFVEYYVRKIGELNPEIFFQLLEEMKYHNILSSMHKLNLPVLIIAGDKDNLSPIETQVILHKNIKNSQLYIVKDGSHVPQVDFPSSINERINLFLN